jgi:hypothetical protein
MASGGRAVPKSFIEKSVSINKMEIIAGPRRLFLSDIIASPQRFNGHRQNTVLRMTS